jgi:hypothetical protein
MSIRALAGSSGSAPLAGGSRSSSRLPRLLFVESPRLGGNALTIDAAAPLSTYDRYVVADSTPHRIKVALRTAPAGLAYLEEPEDDDQNPNIQSYLIHDNVSIESVLNVLV